MSQKSLEAPEIIKTIVPDNYQPIYAKKKKKHWKKHCREIMQKLGNHHHHHQQRKQNKSIVLPKIFK